MTSMPRVDMGVMAGSIVVMADQVMQAVHDKREHLPDEASNHYVKAVIAGAIALGAYEMLKRDEHRSHHQGGDDRVDDKDHDGPRPHGHGRRRRSSSSSSSGSNHSGHGGNHPGHGRDLMAEALGAYAFGRQMLGHSDHRILKLVAEGVGALALAKEVDRDLVKR